MEHPVYIWILTQIYALFFTEVSTPEKRLKNTFCNFNDPWTYLTTGRTEWNYKTIQQSLLSCIFHRYNKYICPLFELCDRFFKPPVYHLLLRSGSMTKNDFIKPPRTDPFTAYKYVVIFLMEICRRFRRLSLNTLFAQFVKYYVLLNSNKSFKLNAIY